MKKIIFLFIMIIIFCPSVYASSQSISSKVEAIPNFGGGTYYATQPASVPVPLYQNINTRYNGKLSQVSFYLDNTKWNWNYNSTYTITLNMATEDWRNNFLGPIVVQTNSNGTEQSSSCSRYVSNTFKFVSYKTIKFNFKLCSTMGAYTKFTVYSSNTTSTAITGISNYNLSSIFISDVSANPTPTPIGPTPTPTSTSQATNSDIINNSNQNTQSIIDNNTENTADIIENANQNAEIINDSLNSVCKDTTINLSYDYAMTTGKILNSNGSEVDTNGGAISVYFKIKPNTTYTVGTLASSLPNNFYYCLYSATKGMLSCGVLNSSGETTITTNGYTSYLRISLYNYRQLFLSGPICNDWEKEGLQNIADSINNSNIDDKTGFFTNFTDNTHGLTSIITLPLSTIQSLTNTSCVALSIPIPFTNSNVSLPCMTEVYQNYIPTVYSLWQVISFGIIAYLICLDIFRMVKGFKDPNEDKVEVLDL